MSLIYWISILLSAIVIFSSPFACTVWSDLFLDADLTFIFTERHDRLTDLDTDYPYFHIVRVDNSYTPVHNLLVPESLYSNIYIMEALKYLRVYGYHDTEKSARSKVIFVNLVASLEWKTKCEALILSSAESFQQEFVFGYYHGSQDLVCLARHVVFLRTMKLVVFQDSASSALSVPCLTCDDMMFSKMKTLSLLVIRQTWDAHNKDLHKYDILVQISRIGKCAILEDGSLKFGDLDFCPFAIITNKYNLTLKDNYLYPSIHNYKSFGYEPIVPIDYNKTFGYGLDEVNLRKIDFITLTNPPSPSNGLATFVSPFDWEIWCCLLISVVSVAGFLTLLGCKGLIHGAYVSKMRAIPETGTGWPALFGAKLIMVTFIFLGQVGESSTKLYRNGKAAFILLTIWLFGNLFLMVNYYQGSIYSFLAVLFPLKTPRGVEELVNWNITMVAMDYYVLPAGDGRTYLQDVVLRQLISSSTKNTNFKTFLTKFRSNLLSINENSVKEMLKEIVTENSSRSRPMVALFDFKDTLEAEARHFKYTGNRHIVKNSGDSPFRVVLYRKTNLNLFTPYLLNGLRRIQESGLIQMWTKLKTLPIILTQKKMLSSRCTYFKAVQECLGNLREPVTFHESNAVSVDLILPAFLLCTGFMSFAIAGFLVENYKFLTQSGIQEIMNILNTVRGAIRL